MLSLKEGGLALLCMKASCEDEQFATCPMSMAMDWLPLWLVCALDAATSPFVRQGHASKVVDRNLCAGERCLLAVQSVTMGLGGLAFSAWGMGYKVLHSRLR
jgi:hypothetical protein